MSYVLGEAYHRLALALRDREWMADALCRGRSDLFFTERNSDNRYQGLLPNERRAKALCARCPVRKSCLEYGKDEPYGIWAGTLPSERRKYRDRDTDAVLDIMFEQAVTRGFIAKEDSWQT